MMEHRYKPRGVHDAILDMTDREILMCGPSGCATDRACLEKLMIEATAHPHARMLVVRKVAKSIVTSAQATLKRDVLPEMIADGSVWFQNGNRENPTQYVFSNGSTIALEGLDDPKKILASKWDMIFVQHATDLDLEDWEDLLLTLQGDVVGYTQILADCLPQEPTHWLKLRCDSGKTTLLESRHQDNPKFYDLEFGEFKITAYGSDQLARLNDLTGVRRSRNALGLWAVAEGVIYEKFDARVHMVRAFEPPQDWGRVWGIDFGFSNAFSWGNWVREPDGRLILHQEIYMTHRTVEEHTYAILKAVRGQPRPEKIVCDHDAQARETLEKILSKEWGFDVETVAAKKSVKVGIDAVNKRFKRHDIAFMHGALLERDPELVKLQLPTCGVEELPSYIWSDALQDQPLKRGDHFCDQMRYVVMEEDSVRAIGVRMRRR